MHKILVSVWMLAYNHENYIKQAINSVLSQRGSFELEIIIGEDCSTDKTRFIIKEYERQYPEIIKPIYYKNNVGIQQNFVNVIEKCKGKYVALCEGDDYWIDNLKLQKQIDFLEQNQEYSFCCHSSSEVTEKGKEYKVANRKGKDIITLADVLQEGWFIRTASIVCRKSMLPEFPDFFYSAYSTDYIFQIMLLKSGNGYFLPDKMSAYRSHPGGVSKTNNVNQLKRWANTLILLDKIGNYVEEKYITNIEANKTELGKKINWQIAYWFPDSIQMGQKFIRKHFSLSTFLLQALKKSWTRLLNSKYTKTAKLY